MKTTNDESLESTQGTDPQRKKKQCCFARRHQKPGDCAYYQYAFSVSRGPRGSGVFYSDDRRDAEQFGPEGVSNRTIFDSRQRLEKAGWLVRIDKGEQKRQNPATGKFASIRYRVLSHDEWVAANPGHCRFPKQERQEIPDAVSAAGNDSPDAECSDTCSSFVSHLTQICPSPDAETAAKTVKRDCKEERKDTHRREPTPKPCVSDSDKETKPSGYEVKPDDVQAVIDKIAHESENTVIITQAERPAIEEMLLIGKKSEVLAAFDDFYRDRSDNFGYQMRFAAKEFAKLGPQMVRTYALERERRKAQEAEAEAAIAELRAEGKRNRVAREAQEAEDQKSLDELFRDLEMSAVHKLDESAVQ